MKNSDTKQNMSVRPPVVAVMGHIDHGKSTLLDYIRKTNVVSAEAGGITQHISAYEVIHKGEDGADKKITFLDTPGHEAFSKMRERGAIAADIAILVVSAEDGVKAQTIEAYKTIEESKTPCIVAINKIDKPGANPEKTKMDLAEKEIYLESHGGKIPFIEISAKTGDGVDSLLNMILLVAELEGFYGNSSEEASGIIIESNMDAKRGVQATLLIKDGSISKGMFVCAGESIAGTRIMEDFNGQAINKASFSSPIRIVGFDKIPAPGTIFSSFKKKSEAGECAYEAKTKQLKNNPGQSAEKEMGDEIKIIPIVIKADTFGSIEAIEKEIERIKVEKTAFKILSKGAGPIGESDIKTASSSKEAIILGFNVKADKNILELNGNLEVEIKLFDIIYKLTDYLKEEAEKRRPRIETVETTGKAKVLKIFSQTKEKQIVGGKVFEGKMLNGETIKIVRRDFEIGKGKIVGLEKAKSKTREVEEGSEFGMMVETKVEIAPGDTIECVSISYK